MAQEELRAPKLPGRVSPRLRGAWGIGPFRQTIRPRTHSAISVACIFTTTTKDVESSRYHNQFTMADDNGDDVQEVSTGATPVLPKEILDQQGQVKLFNKWTYEDVEIRDISLT